MAESIPTLKVFVNLENRIAFTCPECSRPTSIDIDSLKQKISPLKVRCACKSIFSLDIDYRRYYRKQTSISGTCRSIRPHSSREEEILVVNLSMGGIGFKVTAGWDIEVGHRLELKFQLDDRKKTSLRKVAEVVYVGEDIIGCRFESHQVFEQALGYYLQR